MVTSAPTRGRPRKSQLEKVVDDYYRRLDRMESRAIADIEDAMRRSLREIDGQIETVLEKISKASPFADTRDLSYQYARLTALQTQARETLNRFGDNVAEAVQILQTNASEAGQSSVIRALNAGYRGDDFGIVSAFNLLPQTTINELIGTLADGSPVTDLARSFGDLGGQAFREEMIRGIGLGLNPRTVARTWRNRIQSVSRSKAQTIARTEMMRVSRESARRTMEANSDVVKEWQWYCSLDSRTCPVCWAMHNTKHSLKTKMASHPNCRCTMLPVTKTFAELGIPGVSEAIEDERLRLPGETLFKRLPVADQIKVLGPGAYRAYSANAVSLADFVGEAESPIWGKSRYRKSLSEIMGRSEAKKYYARKAALPKGTTISQFSDDPEIRAIQERIARGIDTHMDAIDVGEAIHRQTIRDMETADVRLKIDKDRLNNLDRRFEELNTRLYGDNPIEDGAEREALRNERDRVQQQRFDLQDRIKARRPGTKEYQATLRKVRPGYGSNDGARLRFMGFDSDPESIQSVRDQASKLPKEWVDDWERHPITTKRMSRAHFNPKNAGPNAFGGGIDPDVHVGTSLILDNETTIHELTHYTEFLNPKILDLEGQFYRYRTSGEPLQKMKDLYPGSGYEPWEETRTDKFLHPYMGKDYGGRFYELASMGVENTIGGVPGVAMDLDPEYQNFILGLLAGV